MDVAVPLVGAPLLAVPLLGAAMLEAPLDGALDAALPEPDEEVDDEFAWPGELEQAAKTIAEAATRAVSDTARVLLMGFLSECLRTRQHRPHRPPQGSGHAATNYVSDRQTLRTVPPERLADNSDRDQRVTGD